MPLPTLAQASNQEIYMKIVKAIISKALEALGYELHRSSEQRVSLSSFINLAQAYEHHLNESGEFRNEVQF